MKKDKVLLAEDDSMIGLLVKEYLQKQGFIVELVSDGKKAYSKFCEYKPDICLLDINMPERNGFSLASDIRKLNLDIPIIFLSSNSSTDDVVRGFDLGGNDYLKKPFSMDELVARINFQLRRFVLCDTEYQNNIGDLFFNSLTQELSMEGKVYKLTFRESRLLKLLVEKKNQILVRRIALEALWGEDNPFNSRSMDVFISRIRAYFKDDSNVDIVNIRGVGYKMICSN